MSEIDRLVEDFLAQKKIAVVGVSDRRETGCNLAYRRFKEAGYEVAAVNPRLAEFEGDPCYPDLRSIPEKPEAVFILTKPGITEQLVDQCVELGIERVWMHCMMGAKPGLVRGMTSVSPDAVQKCDSRELPEPVPERGFRALDDAGPVAHARVPEDQPGPGDRTLDLIRLPE